MGHSLLPSLLKPPRKYSPVDEMEDMEKDFAKDMIKRFGEDRFYHAMLRWGTPRELKLIHVGLGGTEAEWVRKCDELRLVTVGEGIISFPALPAFSKGEPWEVLCRTAFTISACFKEYALKAPTLPPQLHARMVLGAQNEWTRKYAEKIKEE